MTTTRAMGLNHIRISPRRTSLEIQLRSISSFWSWWCFDIEVHERERLGEDVVSNGWKTIMSGFGRKLFVADVMHCGRGTLPVLSGSVWLLHPALRSCRHYDRIEKVMFGKCVCEGLQEKNVWLYLALICADVVHVLFARRCCLLLA